NPLMVPQIESHLRSIKNLTSITVEQQLNPIGSWDDDFNDFSWGKKSIDMVSKFEEEVNLFQTYWNSSRIYGKKVR
ncbi:10577_t:CDS:2, partial [Scutellospora calospora]